MNPLEWFVAGTAEMYVAYREDWKLYQISPRGWVVTGFYAAAVIALLVWVIA